MNSMKRSISNLLLFFFLIIFIGAACQLPLSQQAEPSPEKDLESTIIALQTQIIAASTNTETVKIEETITSTDTPDIKQPDLPSSTGYQGFYVLQNDQFVAYDFDGNSLGVQFPAGSTAWYGDDVFAGFMDRVIYAQFSSESGVYQVNGQGTQKLDFIEDHDPVYISVSSDQQHIAWSTSSWEEGALSTEIFYSDLDGNNIQLIQSISSEEQTDMTVIFIPLKWLDDGRLVYENALTGIGGYMLFWGYNSLFVYDPANGTTSTLVDDPERLGICLSSFTDDLDKVAIVCGGDGTVRVRTLSTGIEISYPILEDQTMAGAARFSPSGEWLAYVIQRADPNRELGKIVVVPVDGSQAPRIVATVDGGSFDVERWIDEESILVSRNLLSNNENVILKITRDGSEVNQIVEGLFLDFINE